MASGLERGSRSANRLNQADMSLDPPEAAEAAAAAARTHTHTHTHREIIRGKKGLFHSKVR